MINTSNRYTDYSRGASIHNDNLLNSQLDKSPVFKYGGQKADLSPFGGMRRTFTQRTFGPMQ